MDRADLQLRKARCDAGERRMYAFGNRRRVRAGLLLDRERHRVHAVEPRRRRALFEAVHNAPDVANAHGRAAVRSKDDVLDLVDRLELSFRAERDRLGRLTHLSARKVDVLGSQLLGDHGHRQAERFEPAGIELDLDLPHLAAVDFDRGDAVDLLEKRLEIVFDLTPRECPSAVTIPPRTS